MFQQETKTYYDQNRIEEEFGAWDNILWSVNFRKFAIKSHEHPQFMS